MLIRIRTFIDHRPNVAFLLGSCLIAGMLIQIGIIRSWEYLPDWAPIPGPPLMTIVSCFRPIFLFICGLPAIIAFLGGLIFTIRSLRGWFLSKNWMGLVSLAVGLVILGLSILPLTDQAGLERYLIRYAISRYDVAIDAIEKYHADYGNYPPSLDVLVPTYLGSVPGKYMKFGEMFKYYPDPSSKDAKGYIGSGPFIFELTGMYAGIHGQTLKYCPIQDDTCQFRSRIDDRWVFAYDTIL